jgi:lysophospholipid acyltransferase (LPLAT)-like uncharacterized protein
VAATGGGTARESTAARASAFRRHWTWWRSVEVTVLGTLVAIVLRVLYVTLRVRWTDVADVLDRHRRGERFLVVTWYDELLLLPLVMLCVPGRFRPRVLLSWHRDAEIAAQAARWFGVRAVRGSSTRGSVGAVRGLLAARLEGDDVVVVSDGPRGPRHEVKDGIAQLGLATRTPIVPVALAATPCRRLRNWDRTVVPRPFGRVAIRFGPPVDVADDVAATRARVQAAMAAALAEAERDVAGVA